MRRPMFWLSTALLTLSACECGETAPPPPPSPAEIRATFENEATQVVNRMAEMLRGELGTAIKAGGMAHAIDVCKDRAPAIAAEVGTPELVVRRIGTKLRNSATNTPTPGQKAQLDKLTRDNKVFVGEIDGKLTYLRGIFLMNSVCLRCHGPEPKIDAEVLRKLAEYYPEDRAIDHKIGDLRGAFVVVKQ